MNNGVESCTCPAGYTGEICDMLIPTITPPITTSSTITPSTTLSSTITPSTTTYPTTTTSGSSQGSKETTTNYIQSKIHLYVNQDTQVKHVPHNFHRLHLHQ